MSIQKIKEGLRGRKEIRYENRDVITKTDIQLVLKNNGGVSFVDDNGNYTSKLTISNAPQNPGNDAVNRDLDEDVIYERVKVRPIEQPIPTAVSIVEASGTSGYGIQKAVAYSYASFTRDFPDMIRFLMRAVLMNFKIQRQDVRKMDLQRATESKLYIPAISTTRDEITLEIIDEIADSLDYGLHFTRQSELITAKSSNTKGGSSEDSFFFKEIFPHAFIEGAGGGDGYPDDRGDLFVSFTIELEGQISYPILNSGK